ncbi:hypothetical protein swp_1468 [Shewanella piezotolerans WP3]|uniref:Uncharacterized protein n=1 Tax=Shewanella piezotolerans (strain WP3 / JCM 13877) TaxID=225849 RepID=B8CKS8_SHEPW|nr:hypothetical protein swp_1468 [Shewanella piezotolerans WP3]
MLFEISFSNVCLLFWLTAGSLVWLKWLLLLVILLFSGYTCND